MAQERIQKILAQVGIASRRKAEELIRDGLVTVNGKIAQLGDKAEAGKDAIKVQGKLLHQKTAAPIYIAFNKPKSVISVFSDPEGRPTLADFFKKVTTRVFPVGRLDFNSEGLILLTNDGDFAEKMQKNTDILRVYTVKIKGQPDPEIISRLEKGARVVGLKQTRMLKPFSVRYSQELTSKSMVEVGVLGGGAFDVKALFEQKGVLVDRIVRTAIGHITLRGLPSGHFRFLKASQVLALLERPDLGMRVHEQQLAKGVKKTRSKSARGTSKSSARETVKIIPRTNSKPKGRLSRERSEPVRIRPRRKFED